jgi:tetratricopeptide (TPR) repeat protein
MHRSMFCGVFLLLVVCKGGSVLADEFDRANEAAATYAKGDFRTAADLYEELLSNGNVRTELYVNLGNTYFKLGEYGLSVLNYERAYVLSPGDPDVQHNLQVVRARLKDQVEPIPLLFVVEWWNALKNHHSATAIFIWSVILLWLCAFTVFFFFGSRSILVRRFALLIGSVVSALFVANVFLLLDKQEDLEARRSAIVLSKVVTARSSPDASGVDAFTVHEGLKVEVLDSSEEQCQIRLADGKQGWVRCAAIERI